MLFREYQEQAARTGARKPGDQLTSLLAVYALGLTGEAGEVAELFADKNLRKDHNRALKEYGDVLWYAAMLPQLIGMTPFTADLDDIDFGTPFLRFVDDVAVLEEALNLNKCAGRAAERIKKHLGHGHDLSTELLLHDIRNVVRSLARLADWHLFTLNDVAEANITKLLARFPNGFSHEASKQRAE